MIKKILFSTLFMMIGYSSFGQSGQYTIIIQDGYCFNTNTGITEWVEEPKLFIIDPTGDINETALTPINSVSGAIERVAEFNALMSDFRDQGYVPSVGCAVSTTYNTVISNAFFDWNDKPCSSIQAGIHETLVGGQIITLAPPNCCTPP